jgi:hypothetical protein
MARPRYIHDPTALRIAHFRLYELGYRLTNVYGDGVLNYTRPDGMMVFVSVDGVCDRPRTYDTMVAHAELFAVNLPMRKCR